MRQAVWGLMLMLLPALTWAADDTPWWQFWTNRQQDTKQDQVTARQASNLLFSEAERQRLREYLRRSHRDDGDDGHADDERGRHKKSKDKGNKGKQKPLPPGLQKKLARGGELPPGWQKKLARGEVIDGDLYSQSEPLPYDWARQLHDPAGTETRVIGDKVFRVMRNTREILDILGQ